MIALIGIGFIIYLVVSLIITSWENEHRRVEIVTVTWPGEYHTLWKADALSIREPARGTNLAPREEGEGADD